MWISGRSLAPRQRLSTCTGRRTPICLAPGRLARRATSRSVTRTESGPKRTLWSAGVGQRLVSLEAKRTKRAKCRLASTIPGRAGASRTALVRGAGELAATGTALACGETSFLWRGGSFAGRFSDIGNSFLLLGRRPPTPMNGHTSAHPPKPEVFSAHGRDGRRRG